MIPIENMSGKIMFEVDATSIRAALEIRVGLRADLGGANLRGADLGRADLGGANLRGADLGRANLRGANLWGADLWRANLRGADLWRADLWRANLRGADLWRANLRGADLGRANLRGANLWGADLWRANLRGADLWRADLRGADLGGANLRGADLGGIKMSWDSHALIAEVLFRAAGKDTKKRQIAGLVAVSVDFCWDDFLALKVGLKKWALGVLAPYAKDDESAPDVLRDLAAKIKDD